MGDFARRSEPKKSQFSDRLLEKVLALKPRIVLMDLHLRDEYKFKPEFVRSELQASAGHVLACHTVMMTRPLDFQTVTAHRYS
jgi:hypothetical protein